MKRHIQIKDSAISDLDFLYRQGVERWGRGQARAYLEAMDSLFDLLAEQPEIARERREFNPPVHVHPFRSHVVIFTANDLVLDVIRVVHGKSNWTNLVSD